MSFDIFQDKVDLKARRKSLQAIRRAFKKIVEQIEKGKEPKLIIRKRTLSNTIYDPERKLLLLGKDRLVRRFLDEGEARRFMQTVLMASIIYEALANNEYPTIRDLYYRGKHTLPMVSPKDRHKNTWEEQKESDAVLRDVEVLTGKLREEMLILSKEKGKVVGNMKIVSGGDTIDLSRMGHGAYAIESTPDLIDFKDVDAEYVLVVEKDAVFQQLHRIGYWRKTKSILITSAGQPDRATRRFVRRLNEELGLPVYILADSIPADEVVAVKWLDGRTEIAPIERMLGHFFTPGLERERVVLPIMVPSYNSVGGTVEWRPIGYVYRHWIEDKMFRIKTEKHGEIRVTGGHSLFVVRGERLTVVPAREVRVGDVILAAARINTPVSGTPQLSKQDVPLYVWDGETGALVLMNATIKHRCYQNRGVAERGPCRYSDLPLDGWRRKKKVLEALIEGYTPLLEGGGESSRLLVCRASSNTFLDSVTSIEEEDYTGYVYDFMVPGTQSFIAGNGIIYHNSDPYGFYIYSVFKIGSITLSYESERLATPSARFLGVMMSDVFGDDVSLNEIYVSPQELRKGVNVEKLRREKKKRYLQALRKLGYKDGLDKKPFLSEEERRNYIIKAKPQDLERAVELVGHKVYKEIMGDTLKVVKSGRSSVKRSPGYPWFRDPRWIKELGIFFLTRSKLEIEAVASKGLRFLAYEYLPTKIETNDWLD